jgi:ferredoxin
MRIVGDTVRCTGHGRCYDLAPEIFDADDEGHVSHVIEGEVPAELDVKARQTVANCPEWALSISG